MISTILIFLHLALAFWLLLHSPPPPRPRFTPRAARASHRKNAPKPEWVPHDVLLIQEQLQLSHHKTADTFNQRHFASTGISVGRTFVRELLIKQSKEGLRLQQELKHALPREIPTGHIWGIDATHVTDANGAVHTIFGIVDHGSRFALTLRPLRRLNAWTLLGTLFLAIGEFGKPKTIKLDNHPVHRSHRVRRVLLWGGAGVRPRFNRPASPWQNGRVERFFGTLKASLRGLPPIAARDVRLAMNQFRFYYNCVRPHQHLNGRTPEQVWRDIDPYTYTARSVRYFSAWEGRLRGWVLRH